MPNRIEKNHELKKYEWQKPHQPNQTGTEKAYYPNKDKKMLMKKNIKLGKNNIYISILNILFCFHLND